MSAPCVPAGRLVWIVAGFLVWSAAFVALYSMQAIGCRFGWDEMVVAGGIGGGVSLHRVVLVVLFAISLAAAWTVVALARKRREGASGPLSSFMEVVAWLAALAALVSTAISLGPVLFLTACY